jgi:outer membrane murein-binding lipoprotein Lpp
MFVSEDGYITGSVDWSKFDEIEPKSDEAKAQHAALKAERDAGREQVARDEERLAELSRRQSPHLRTDEERAEAENKGLESSKRQEAEAERRAAERQKAAEEQKAAQDKAAADKASSRKQG